MPRSHLKRLAAPKTWNIERKTTKYIARPLPGAHPFEYSMPISLAIRELIRICRTAKEAKRIIKHKDVFVDKVKRSNHKYPVGFMDVVEFPQLEEQYRILIDEKGRLIAVKADKKEAGLKLSKIRSKTKISGGKTQINLSDGRNIIADKDTYSVGDTLVISLPDQKITDTLKFEKGALAILIGGKHAGAVAKLEEISGAKIIIKGAKNQRFETAREYAFVVGKDKPALDSIKNLTKQN
jgi:small subunit ribosomal protein S4e